MVVFHLRVFSIQGRLQAKVIFHPRLSSIQSRLLSKVVFHSRSSSIQGNLPHKLPSIQACPPSAIQGLLPSKFVFHPRSSFFGYRVGEYELPGPSKIPKTLPDLPELLRTLLFLGTNHIKVDLTKSLYFRSLYLLPALKWSKIDVLGPKMAFSPNSKMSKSNWNQKAEVLKTINFEFPRKQNLQANFCLRGGA